jgi:hypothetical protein
MMPIDYNVYKDVITQKIVNIQCKLMILFMIVIILDIN